MEQSLKHRKICQSWYHRTWFRIILVIVGIDMIVLGASLILGFDLLTLLVGIHMMWRIIGGIAYILTASFILHYAFSYRHFRKKHAFVCQHCAHHTEEKNKEDSF